MRWFSSKTNGTILPLMTPCQGDPGGRPRASMSDDLACSASISPTLLSAALGFFFLGNFPLKGIGYGVLMALTLVVVLTKIKNVQVLLTSSWSLLFLWSLLIASYFWSAVPSATASVIISQSAFIVFSLCLAAIHLSSDISGSLKKVARILLILVIAYVAINPGYSISGFGLRSFYAQKNLLGAMMAVSALVFLFSAFRQKLDFSWASVALVLLALSLSKTSIILFFLCALLTVFVDLSVIRKKTASQAITVRQLLGGLLLVLLGIVLLVMVVYSEEVIDFFWGRINNELFTGRGRLWLVVIQQVRGDSLLGIGPGVLWQAGGASEIAQTTLYQRDPYWIQHMVSSDGSYIDLFASLGVLGIALFLFTAVDLYRRLFKNWNQRDSKLIFSLVTFVLLHGITESTILYSTNILWLIYLLCYFRVAGYGRNTELPSVGKERRALAC